MIENNIPEKVREQIRNTLEEATLGMEGKHKEVMMHIITQISFEMYKKGWSEAHRCMIKAVELSGEAMK